MKRLHNGQDELMWTCCKKLGAPKAVQLRNPLIIDAVKLIEIRRALRHFIPVQQAFLDDESVSLVDRCNLIFFYDGQYISGCVADMCCHFSNRKLQSK